MKWSDISAVDLFHYSIADNARMLKDAALKLARTARFARKRRRKTREFSVIVDTEDYMSPPADIRRISEIRPMPLACFSVLRQIKPVSSRKEIEKQFILESPAGALAEWTPQAGCA